MAKNIRHLSLAMNKILRLVVIVIVCLWILGLPILLILDAVHIHNRRESFKPFVTYKRLTFIAAGCDKFKKQNGEWPKSLEQLQMWSSEFSDPWDKDAWNYEVKLVPYNGSVGFGELISYGRDGKLGGTGLDRDLIVHFPIDSNVQWNEGQATNLPIPRR